MSKIQLFWNRIQNNINFFGIQLEKCLIDCILKGMLTLGINLYLRNKVRVNVWKSRNKIGVNSRSAEFMHLYTYQYLS